MIFATVLTGLFVILFVRGFYFKEAKLDPYFWVGLLGLLVAPNFLPFRDHPFIANFLLPLVAGAIAGQFFYMKLRSKLAAMEAARLENERILKELKREERRKKKAAQKNQQAETEQEKAD